MSGVTVDLSGDANLLIIAEPGLGLQRQIAAYARSRPAPSDAITIELAMIFLGAGIDATARSAPFRAPHHTCSATGIVGGTHVFCGRKRARPGEMSLAHGGVLLLDDLPEFSKTAIEAMSGVIDRGAACLNGVDVPARCRVIATALPCPCGRATSTTLACTCTSAMRQRYTGIALRYATILGLDVRS